MKVSAVVLVVVALLLVPGPASSSVPELVTELVHFDVRGGDLIPGVAAFRAACDANVSGEPLTIEDNATVRTTIAASPEACVMILILLGQEVALPTITTTPIGRSSYYLPGISLPTLGLADVSLDLQSSLNSTSRARDDGAAAVDGDNVSWAAWGAQRLLVHAAHGYGGVLMTSLESTFTYALSLGLTIWVAGIQMYRTGLREFGAYEGSPSLATPLSVDLLPHPLALGSARDLTDQGANLNWTGTIDADFDHLELWVTDGATNVSYRIADRVASSVSVPLRAETTYHAWIVAADRGGQETVSNGITFRTLATPPPEPAPSPPRTYTEDQANVIVILTFASIAVLACLVGYGLGRTRGQA